MAARRQSPVENDKPVREQDKVMLRLPDGMRDRLKEAASANRRSMNAEIVQRLEDSFAFTPEDPETRLKVIFDASRANEWPEGMPSTEEIFADELNRAISQAIRSTLALTIDKLADRGLIVSAQEFDDAGRMAGAVYVPSKARQERAGKRQAYRKEYLTDASAIARNIIRRRVPDAPPAAVEELGKDLERWLEGSLLELDEQRQRGEEPEL